MPLKHRLRAVLALAAVAFLAACAAPPANPPAVEAAITPSPALHVEGLPPVPQRLLAPIQRWTSVSGHRFVDWHPTGREMLVSHRPPGASTTQIFRVRAPLAPLEPLTDGADPVSVANWEPRHGRYIVFARGSRGNEAFQLYRLDPDTRAVTQLTDPDQRHALQGWLKSKSLMVVTSVPLDRTAAGGRRGEITTTVSLIDALQPASRRVVAELPGGGWFGAEVSPDERQLAMTRYVSAAESEIWLIDLGDGQRRRLLPAAGEVLRASHFVSAWMPDGRSLLLGSDRAGEFREVMRFELDSGALTRLSADIPWDTGASQVSADGRWLAFTVNVDGRDELRVLDRGTALARPDLPDLPQGSIGSIGWHHARPELALVVDSAQGPSTVYSFEPASSQVLAWTQPAADPTLDLASLPDQQVVRWLAFDGRTISGVLTLPPARFAGPRPVLMLMHGGPESQAKQGWRGRLNFLVQELGVALLEPNVRGSSGYGKTFLTLDNGRLREDSVKDMASALDWVAGQPRLDADRVLAIGGSYGGYMALAASVRLADRIAGAVSVVGISNFVSFLENTESYRRDLRRVEYGDERDPAMRAFLQGISPLNLAGDIRKPLFVVQGKNDPRVPWTESEQIVRKLQARGTPVWYLLADNEGHGFARRENADFYFAALATFIEQTLLR